jgi:serine acetyltransferase
MHQRDASATLRAASRARSGARLRIAWMIASFAVVQSMACGLAALPIVLLWQALLGALPDGLWIVLAISVLALPSYGVFAIFLMAVSAVTLRLLGWQTPRDTQMRLADFDWPVLNWARSMAALHVVRVLAGSLFRASPIWTAYLRWSGARIGRRVYVGSLALSDYNLLEFGDDVVIGADVHLSGHTVEGGIVKTAGVRLGRGVTIGLGSVIDIGVQIGDGCQVGALSLVPKGATLEAGAVYVGRPVRRVR